MQITAAVARTPHGDFTVEAADIDAPRADEVLVRINGVGLCHTDLIARDGFIPIALPAVLGHEGAGIVEAVGSSVTKVAPGDRVVLSFSSCGHCARCDDHLPSYCREFPSLNYAGARADGTSGISIAGTPASANFFGQSSFASHALTFERNVVRIDDADAPLEILGPLGCGFQTGAGGIMRSLACPAGSTLAIFGGGPVGLTAVMGAVVQGCLTIILVEPIAARRDLARDLGATHVIDPADGDVTAAIRAIVPDGVDFAFESSGREAVVEAALAALASHGPRGRAAQAGEQRVDQSGLAHHLRPSDPRDHRRRQRPGRLHSGTGGALPSRPVPDRQADQDLPPGRHQRRRGCATQRRLREGRADPLTTP
jgi:aryl-alcohol dehydrogenase